MRSLKDPLTYKEQVERLKSHNLTIYDEEHAVSILSRTNYYRLTAYGIGLKKPGNDEEYIDGTSLDDLYRIYQFDCKLRNLIFGVVESLEIQLRSQIAYYLAHEYGAGCLENGGNFKKDKNKDGGLVYDDIMRRFKEECDHQKKTPFVEHHILCYGGHFPVWVAIELFSFGNLSYLYSIMLPKDQKAVAECYYDTAPRFLRNWIQSLLEVRNDCAHYDRIYNMPLKQTPHLYSEYKKFVKKNQQNKIFPVLLIIKRMMMRERKDGCFKKTMVMRDSDSKRDWQYFVCRLDGLINDYGDVIRLAFMDFPDNWKEILEKDTDAVY